MFTALAGLIADNEEINVKITGVGKDGRMKVVVMPKAVKGSHLAMAQPLALAATPEELDSGFIHTLQQFGAARSALAEQVSVTTTIIAAAQQTEAGKATKALQSKGAPQIAMAAPAGSDDVGDNGSDILDAEEIEASDTSSSTPPAPPAAPVQPAPANANDDLLELF